MRIVVAKPNWRSHIYRDCHTIATMPDYLTVIEDGTVPEVVDVPRRWCSYCVARFMMANQTAIELATELGASPVGELELEAGSSAEMHPAQPWAGARSGL